MAREVRPQPGPQSAFDRTTADICVFGGQAGGGKSWSMVFDAGRYSRAPGFTAGYFRRTYPELVGGGSLWELANELYPPLGGRLRESDMDVRFPSGALLEFHHLQHEKSARGHQGKAYCGLYFDELTHFSEGQWWYLLSRNRSTCGVRPYVRASCNPDPDSFVRQLIDWWIGEDGYPIAERDGVLRWFIRSGDDLFWDDTAEALVERFPGKRPRSLTFIRSRLEDNRILEEADPDYRANLDALPRVERERLLGGNWNIRPAAGLYFQRDWFPIVAAPPEGRKIARVRCWDLATTAPSSDNPDPDWTRGPRMSRHEGRYYIEHMASLRGSPGEVEELMLRTAERDGPRVPICIWQDPGQAGKYQVEKLRKKLAGFVVKSVVAAKNKIAYAGPLSSQAEARNVSLVQGPWVEPFLLEAEGFPDAAHDDQIDACSRGFMELDGGGVERWKAALG